MEENFKSGFVSVIGRPNVGKSTLVNALVGQKVTITSERPQTTRNQIQGIMNFPGHQVAFIDTPGIHKPKDRMGEFLMEVALNALEEVDGLLFVVDGEYPPGKGDQYIYDLLKQLETPVIGVINKADKMEKGMEEAYAPFFDDKYCVLSALKRQNLNCLVEKISRILPEGPQFFPEEMFTNQLEQFVAAELIREKAFELTREEVPHSVAVEIESMGKRKGTDIVDIYAHIFVQRNSQKGILIGQGGERLKEIGCRAREDIEKLLGSKIYLNLWVKVKKDWRDREEEMRRLGYR